MTSAAEHSEGFSSGEDEAIAARAADSGANSPSGLVCVSPTTPAEAAATAQRPQKRLRTPEETEPAKIGRAKMSGGHFETATRGSIDRPECLPGTSKAYGGNVSYLSPLICAVFIVMIPLWVAIAKQSPPIAEVLKSGWQPVIVAMTISSIGGLILNKTVAKPNFEGMAVFTPVINGVGGNLVAIQASRISTFLHFWSMPGVLPYKMRQHWPNPCTTFFTSGVNSKSARVLILLVIPGHLVFLYTIHVLQGGHISLTFSFVSFYLIAALLQVGILLYMADLIVRLMWRKGLDPDNFSIPYLTALGDLLGTGLLALCFLLVWVINGPQMKLGN